MQRRLIEVNRQTALHRKARRTEEQHAAEGAPAIVTPSRRRTLTEEQVQLIEANRTKALQRRASKRAWGIQRVSSKRRVAVQRPLLSMKSIRRRRTLDMMMTPLQLPRPPPQTSPLQPNPSWKILKFGRAETMRKVKSCQKKMAMTTKRYFRRRRQSTRHNGTLVR